MSKRNKNNFPCFSNYNPNCNFNQNQYNAYNPQLGNYNENNYQYNPYCDHSYNTYQNTRENYQNIGGITTGNYQNNRRNNQNLRSNHQNTSGNNQNTERHDSFQRNYNFQNPQRNYNRYTNKQTFGRYQDSFNRQSYQPNYNTQHSSQNENNFLESYDNQQECYDYNQGSPENYANYVNQQDNYREQNVPKYDNCQNSPNNYENSQMSQENNINQISPENVCCQTPTETDNIVPTQQKNYGNGQKQIHFYRNYQEPLPDAPSNGVITKNSLYRKHVTSVPTKDDTPEIIEPQSWTDNYWKKQNNDKALDDLLDNKRKTKKKLTNKIERKLTKMLSQPVEGKGMSMLQKMGWDGGGLGKDGDGIVEPIAPKATYAATTMGLGNSTGTSEPKFKRKVKVKPANRPKSAKAEAKAKVKIENREIRTEFGGRFKINILNVILEFVTDDTKLELKFDSKLTNAERKKIHKLVESLKEVDDEVYSQIATVDQQDVLHQILEYNYYVLRTVSEGKGVQRYITVYKDAPENMYLITPDYLREEPEDDKEKDVNETSGNESKGNNFVKNNSEEKKRRDMKNKNENQLKTGPSVNENENESQNKDEAEIISQNIEDAKIKVDNQMKINDESNLENNPAISNVDIEISSVKSELKEEHPLTEESSEDPLDLIIDYFLEFTENTEHVEFRFLGSFNDTEKEGIEDFYKVFRGEIEYKNSEKVREAVNNDSYTYDIVEDKNGCFLIKKNP